MKNILFFLILLFISLNIVNAENTCGKNFLIEQQSNQIVCDGSQNILSIRHIDNNWDGFEEVVLFPSNGINFNTYPLIKLVDSNNFNLNFFCKDVSEGYIEIIFSGNEKSCKIIYTLNNVKPAIKNENNEIIITKNDSISDLNEFKNKDIYQNAFILTIFVLIILFLSFFLIKFIYRHKKNILNRKK